MLSVRKICWVRFWRSLKNVNRRTPTFYFFICMYTCSSSSPHYTSLFRSSCLRNFFQCFTSSWIFSDFFPSLPFYPKKLNLYFSFISCLKRFCVLLFMSLHWFEFFYPIVEDKGIFLNIIFAFFPHGVGTSTHFYRSIIFFLFPLDKVYIFNPNCFIWRTSSKRILFVANIKIVKFPYSKPL